MSTAATPALIDPAALQALLGRPDVVVLDVRSEVAGGGRAAFEAGHVPGAIRTDYVEDGWRASVGPAPGMLPEAARLGALFGRLGIRPESHVVIVPSGASSGDFSVAARIFWTFRAAGHRRLSMLDGGTAGWSAAGGPAETGAARPPAPALYPVTLDPGVRAELDRVAAIVADGSAALVDARGLAHFTGEARSPAAARAGRLPGAVHVDGAGLLDPATGRLRPRDVLEALFAPVGEGPAVAFCNTGQAAATDWFVLAEILGRADIRLYDGSMSEWTADPARPVATG